MWRVACHLEALLQSTAAGSWNTLCSQQAVHRAVASISCNANSRRHIDRVHQSITDHLQGSRRYATASDDSKDKDVSSIGNEKVQKIAEDILGLSVLESSWLTEILRKKLGLQKPAFGAMPAFPVAAPAAQGAAATGAGPAAAPAEEKKPEKTTFDVKLESFTPDGKIKVIKEIRAITNLGLKEAKELVEKAPVVIKANVAKADAEAMKKQIETVGAKVSLG